MVRSRGAAFIFQSELRQCPDFSIENLPPPNRQV